jgi:hypothetical protein
VALQNQWRSVISTRCNVIIKDQYSKLYFYRHSDGYPEGVAPTRRKFMEYVRTGNIRDNVSQSAGWLVLIGHGEYAESGNCGTSRCRTEGATPTASTWPGNATRRSQLMTSTEILNTCMKSTCIRRR